MAPFVLYKPPEYDAVLRRLPPQQLIGAGWVMMLKDDSVFYLLDHSWHEFIFFPELSISSVLTHAVYTSFTAGQVWELQRGMQMRIAIDLFLEAAFMHPLVFRRKDSS